MCNPSQGVLEQGANKRLIDLVSALMETTKSSRKTQGDIAVYAGHFNTNS